MGILQPVSTTGVQLSHYFFQVTLVHNQIQSAETCHTHIG